MQVSLEAALAAGDMNRPLDLCRSAFSDVKLEYEAFKYIPSTYLITEDDRCVPFQGQVREASSISVNVD
jgi:hypothetical protein